MIPISTLIVVDSRSSKPVYIQISGAMINLIQRGVLSTGTRLPSIRKMAASLKVHPKTVVAAYEEMMAQDWIYSKPRAGVFVSDKLPELKPRSFTESYPLPKIRLSTDSTDLRPKYQYIINDGFPDHRLVPIEPLTRFYKNAFYNGHTEKFSLFTDPAGSYRLRVALRKYLNESRALKISRENILITRGAQMAISIAAATLIKAGDYVIAGEPGYSTANITFERLGARLLRVPVDENGIDVGSIEVLLKTRKPKLLYIVPHHHHPTTVTLSAARRMKLLSLIRKHRLYVIEDDYDYEFHYGRSPILPLASADHDGYVLYVGSITKNLTTSMRVGYLVASEKLISQAMTYKRELDLRGDILLEDAVASLYEKGIMQRHIRKSVKLYEERRDMFCRMLQTELSKFFQFTIPDGGMAVWAQLNRKYSLPQVASLAAAKGLWISDGKFYNSSTVNYNSLRMGFASLTEKEMVKAVAILSEILKKYH